MDVSKNTGTPKSFILIGFSIINHPFWGTPIFGNTHIYCLMGTPIYYYYPQKFPYSLYVTGEMTYIAPLYNWSYGPLLINGCLVPSCKKILSWLKQREQSEGGFIRKKIIESQRGWAFGCQISDQNMVVVFFFRMTHQSVVIMFNKGWSWTMEEVSWTKSEPNQSNRMPYGFEFCKFVFHPCISHRAPNPNLRGTHKREDSDDRLTPQGWGKCMSKPKLTVFQTCPVILSNYFETWRSCKFVNHFSFWNIKKPKFHSRHCSGNLVFVVTFLRIFSIATCVLGGLGLRLGL